jgi:hypothetical protein
MKSLIRNFERKDIGSSFVPIRRPCGSAWLARPTRAGRCHRQGAFQAQNAVRGVATEAARGFRKRKPLAENVVWTDDLPIGSQNLSVIGKHDVSPGGHADARADRAAAAVAHADLHA